MPYLDLNSFKAVTTMPVSFITEIETKSPGWIASQLSLHSIRIDAQLRKRYAVPFADPPLVVQGWLAAIVELACWLKRGVSSTDEQFQEYKARAQSALDEIHQAADAVDGLFDLPMSSTVNTSGVSPLGFPRAYSEASPYAWTDVQALVGHTEDDSRGGGSNY